MLDEPALETVDHLSFEEYANVGGDKLILELLESRFPQKEICDQAGEALAAVFQLAGKERETLSEWCGRAAEVVLRCKSKAGMELPATAVGWLLLNRAGLSEDQKAIVRGRAGGEATIRK